MNNSFFAQTPSPRINLGPPQCLNLEGIIVGIQNRDSALTSLFRQLSNQLRVYQGNTRTTDLVVHSPSIMPLWSLEAPLNMNIFSSCPLEVSTPLVVELVAFRNMDGSIVANLQTDFHRLRRLHDACGRDVPARIPSQERPIILRVATGTLTNSAQREINRFNQQNTSNGFCAFHASLSIRNLQYYDPQRHLSLNLQLMAPLAVFASHNQRYQLENILAEEEYHQNVSQLIHESIVQDVVLREALRARGIHLDDTDGVEVVSSSNNRPPPPPPAAPVSMQIPITKPQLLTHQQRTDLAEAGARLASLDITAGDIRPTVNEENNETAAGAELESSPAITGGQPVHSTLALQNTAGQNQALAALGGASAVGVSAIQLEGDNTPVTAKPKRETRRLRQGAASLNSAEVFEKINSLSKRGWTQQRLFDLLDAHSEPAEQKQNENTDKKGDASDIPDIPNEETSAAPKVESEKEKGSGKSFGWIAPRGVANFEPNKDQCGFCGDTETIYKPMGPPPGHIVPRLVEDGRGNFRYIMTAQGEEHVLYLSHPAVHYNLLSRYLQLPEHLSLDARLEDQGFATIPAPSIRELLVGGRAFADQEARAQALRAKTQQDLESEDEEETGLSWPSKSKEQRFAEAAARAEAAAMASSSKGKEQDPPPYMSSNNDTEDQDHYSTVAEDLLDHNQLVGGGGHQTQDVASGPRASETEGATGGAGTSGTQGTGGNAATKTAGYLSKLFTPNLANPSLTPILKKPNDQ